MCGITIRMIVDGRKIAATVYEKMRVDIAGLSRAPRLAIISCAPNFETEKYLALKQKRAKEVGIETELIVLDAESSTDGVLEAVAGGVLAADGVIVQLPLPPSIDTARVLAAVPSTHDVDALNPNTKNILSPVVGALHEILIAHDSTATGKNVTIIGSGKLVGLPAYAWFSAQDAQVSVVTKDTLDIGYYTRPADIIVCGAGVPDLLTPDMVKEEVIILDAGTSEAAGVLRGDASPLCAEKASLFTPVPGGIGPLTIAILLRNVLDCAKNQL
jgi:methylenetetrahydrofolate dehydrogenase (NADP+) / methenyltetrahydrofolate cyclohydrolase